MKPVHPRCHNDQIQELLQVNRQTPVGMMKECCHLKCDEEPDQHYRGDAKNHHCKRKKSNRKNHLAKMESRSGAHIEIEIGMMNVVESPQERDHVIGPMPPPIGVIHQQKCGD